MILWVRNAGKGPRGTLVWRVQDLPFWWLEIWAQLEKSTIRPMHGLSSMEILLVSLHTCGLGLKRKCSHKQREAVEPFRHVASPLPYPAGQSSHRSPTVKRQHTPHFNTRSAKEFAVMS